MTDSIKLDMNRLTLGEVAKVEELSNMPFSAISDNDKPKGLALAALGFVAKRRTDPSFSWNAAQNLTMDDLGELVNLGQEEADEANPLGDAAEDAADPKGE